jgi:phospholipase C
LLAAPRKVSLKLSVVTASKRRKRTDPDLRQIALQGPLSGNVLGTAQIAVDVDWHAAERLRLAPLVTSEFQERLSRASDILARRSPQVGDPKAVRDARLSILEYLHAVGKRDAKARAVELKRSPDAGRLSRKPKRRAVKAPRPTRK